MITIKSPTNCREIFRKALKVTWYEFVDGTTIHGLRYILDPQGTKFTRGLWLIVTLVGFIASNVLVDTFWLRYKANPTRLKIDSFHKPLNLLRLPAITLCQVNYVDVDRAGNFIDQLVLPSNVSKADLLKYLGHGSAFTNNINYNIDEMNILQNVLDQNEISIAQALESIHQPCSDLLFRCRFKYEIRPCKELFEESMSYLGMCCTFNGKNNFMHTEYFQRVAGLSVVMKPKHHSESTTYSRGVKLLVHQSIVFPSDLSVVKMLSHQSENFIRILSDVTKCSSDIQALPFEERDCVFSFEKSLSDAFACIVRVCKYTMLKKYHTNVIHYLVLIGLSEIRCDYTITRLDIILGDPSRVDSLRLDEFKNRLAEKNFSFKDCNITFHDLRFLLNEFATHSFDFLNKQL